MTTRETNPLTLLALAAISVVSTGAAAQSPEAFYKGKTMNVFVGSAPGGGYDAYARVIVRHMPDHMPGHPNMVVKNMPGASGLVLAGYIYNKGAKDGSDIAGIHNTAVVEELLGNKVQFDSRKYNWLGSANQLTSTCVSHAKTGIHTIKDAMEKELLVGATGSASSSTQMVASFMNNLTDTKFKIIRGYPSSTSVFLAMERGEVGGLCGIGWDSLQTQVLQEIKAGKIKIIVQTGVVKSKDLPDVPLVLDLAKTPEDRATLEFLVARQYFGRPYVAPPGVPADRVAVLRKAFTDTMNDPKFQATAAKAQVPLSPIDGQTAQDYIEKLFKTPATIMARANAATSVNAKAVGDADLKWITVKGTKIDELQGGMIVFSDNGKKASASVQGADIMVDGKEASRKSLKVGFNCDVVYLGDRDAAKEVSCTSK